MYFCAVVLLFVGPLASLTSCQRLTIFRSSHISLDFGFRSALMPHRYGRTLSSCYILTSRVACRYTIR